MAKRVALMALALGVLWASGCGTVCNLFSGDPGVYGGLQRDAEFLNTRGNWLSNGMQGPAVFAVPACFAAEFCLSTVGDTLTLPLVILMRQNPRGDDEPVVPRAASNISATLGPPEGFEPDASD
jgi:uncharacterized protein YceK